MVKTILAQLESFARRLQVNIIRRKFLDQTGIKMGQGFLWQHPGRLRQEIISRFEKVVADLDKVV